MLEVRQAKYIRDYIVEIEFGDSMVRVVDLAGELDGENFEPLREPEYFRSFFIDCNTLSWENGADFAPEYLFLISKSLSDQAKNSKIETDTMAKVKKLYGLAS